MKFDTSTSVCAVCGNLLGIELHYCKAAVLVASKEVDLKGNTERAQCVLMSLHQNAEQ